MLATKFGFTIVSLVIIALEAINPGDLSEIPEISTNRCSKCTYFLGSSKKAGIIAFYAINSRAVLPQRLTVRSISIPNPMHFGLTGIFSANLTTLEPSPAPYFFQTIPILNERFFKSFDSVKL